MDKIYAFFNYVGYFFILIIFLIIAIILSKKLYSWVFYIIGATITLLSLLGSQKSYNDYFGESLTEDIMCPYWTIYIILLGVSAVIMIFRYSKTREKSQKNDIQSMEEKVIENFDNSN